MKVCQICKREAGGFGFIPPPLRAGEAKNQKHRRFFCSLNCQDIYSKLFKQNKMIDLTKAEKNSIEYALKPLGEYVAEIGMSRPLADYSREEVLCLIEVAVTAYFDSMQQKDLREGNPLKGNPLEGDPLEGEANSEEDLPC